MYCVFFQAEDGIRDYKVTGVQTCALPIYTWCYSLLAQRLMEEFHPKILVDVGCGGGGIAKAFQNVGCPAIHCFDNSEERSEERRVGKEGRSRWSPDH